MDLDPQVCYTNDMRWRLWSLVFGTCVLGLGAWLAVRPPPPIQVGLVGSLSGRFASLGTTGRDGAVLATEEINASGGIAGRQLELIQLDDRSEGDACVKAYESLAASGCRLAIGPFATGPATAALETVDRLRILTISPTVAGDNFVGRDDWFLRLYPSTRDMGRMLGHMIAADGGASLTIIGDAANGPFVSTMIAGLRESSGPARHIVEVVFDSRTKPDMQAVVDGAAQADVVLLIASSLDAAALAQRLRSRHAEQRLYCSSWSVSKELIANGGRAVDGMRTVLPVALGDADGQALAERFQRRFGEPITHVAMLHFEAVHLLAAALRASGSSDPAGLRSVLTDGTALPGIAPASTLDRNGDPRRSLLPHCIVDGRLRVEATAPAP